MWLNPDWIRRYRKYETTPGWGGGWGGIRFVVAEINEVWPLCMEKLARKDKEINRRHLTTCQIQTTFTGLIRLLSVNTLQGVPNILNTNTGVPNILNIVKTIQSQIFWRLSKQYRVSQIYWKLPTQYRLSEINWRLPTQYGVSEIN